MRFFAKYTISKQIVSLGLSRNSKLSRIFFFYLIMITRDRNFIDFLYFFYFGDTF